MDKRFGSRGPPLNVRRQLAQAHAGLTPQAAGRRSRRSVSHSPWLNNAKHASAALELAGFDEGLCRLAVEEHEACEEEEFPPSHDTSGLRSSTACRRPVRSAKRKTPRSWVGALCKVNTRRLNSASKSMCTSISTPSRTPAVP